LVVLQPGEDSDVAYAIAPDAGQVARQRLALSARVVRARYSIFEVADDTRPVSASEYAQVLYRARLELDAPPGWL
jgi:hypothetical protein